MKRMTLSDMLQHSALGCLLFLAWLAPTVMATPSLPQPAPAFTHTEEGIMHGKPARNLTPPWIARIGIWGKGQGGQRGKHKGICTGNFITKKWVLTARHCVMDQDFEPLQFYQVSVDNGSNPLNLVNISRFFLMPDDTDVALLELVTDYPFPDDGGFYGAPLYHGEGYVFHRKAIVMGFGQIRIDGVYPEALYYTQKTQDGFAALDTFGAPAIRLHRQVPSDGFTAPGDSGGPALLAFFPPFKDVNEDVNEDDEIKRLVGVTSLAEDPASESDIARVNQASYHTRLSAAVLEWVSQKVGMVIISYPADEQVFNTTTNNIAVSWYGENAPKRVFLKKKGTSMNDEVSRCIPQGSRCNLAINQTLTEGAYDISAEREDGSLDTVTVYAAKGGIKLSIVYPPKQEENQGNLHIYKPDVTGSANGSDQQTLYTVSGYGTAGIKLYVRLTRKKADGKTVIDDAPCLDGAGHPMETIEANEQGIWVCDIKVHAERTLENYEFNIGLQDNNRSNLLARLIRWVDTVTFQVDGRGVADSLITMRVENNAGYIQHLQTYSVDLFKPSEVTPVFTPYARFNSDDSNYQSARSTMGNELKIRANLYQHISKLYNIPYLKIQPDVFRTQTISFAKANFRAPVQTLMEEKASIITTNKMLGYEIKVDLDLNQNPPLPHVIKASAASQSHDEEITLCSSEGNAVGDWSCVSKEMLPEIGKYNLTDYVDNNKVFRQTVVYSPPPPIFTFPTQTYSESSSQSNISINEFSAEIIKGIIPLELYQAIQERREKGVSDKNAGTVKIYKLPRSVGDKENPVPQCDIEIYVSSEPYENVKDWKCIQSITELEAGNYEADVQFYSRTGDDIGWTTRFTLIPPNKVTIANPTDGSNVNQEAMLPAGNGEPNAKIELYEEVTHQVKSVSSNSSVNSAPVCTTTVDKKGNWKCGLTATPSENGSYTLTARQKIYQYESEDNSTFNVKRRNDDNDEPQNPSDPHDAPPGPSVPDGPPFPLPPGSKPGHCKVGFIIKINVCHGPKPGDKCPAGYTYRGNSCKGGPIDNNCPSGYIYDAMTQQCTGPAVDGPDFKILFPGNKMQWDCSYNNSCQVYGQIPAGDSASITVVDPVSGKTISGPYNSEVYDNTPTLWQTHSVTLPPGSTVNILATRIHNGQPVPTIDSVQAVQITTPSDTPYAVQWPTMYGTVKSETQDAIYGTAPTGTRVQVTSVPAGVNCDVVSTQERWSCPAAALVPGSYTLMTHWQKPDASTRRAVDDIRYFQVSPLPPVSIVTPSDSSVVNSGYEITGTGYAGAKVSVTGMPSGDKCTDRPVDGNGKWTCGLSYPVVNGQWFLTALQTFSNGLSNTIAKGYFMDGEYSQDLRFTSPDQDAILTTGTYKIAGVGPSGIYETVTVTGMPAGTPACENVGVRNDGYWECPASYSANDPLINGRYHLQANSSSRGLYRKTAWRDFSIQAPEGQVRDIKELNTDVSGCKWESILRYECTTVLQLIDKEGNGVSGQKVQLSMVGSLSLEVNSQNPATSDEYGNVTVRSSGVRDTGNGHWPSGVLTGQSGDVKKEFSVH